MADREQRQSEYRRQATDFLYSDYDEANNNSMEPAAEDPAPEERRRSSGSSADREREVAEADHIDYRLRVHSSSSSLQKRMAGFDYVVSRQYGRSCANPSELYEDMLSKRLPFILRQEEFRLGGMNKVFASQWLNDKQVVFGTKCNQLVVMDIRNGRMTTIPTLQSSEESEAAPQPCGIHGITINPSGTMLATGASNTNDIGIYKLPTFDPLCVGEGAHSDWVFDLEWVDDEFLITGSRDNNMAMWRIDNNMDESQTSRMSCLYVPEYAVKKPLVVKQCDKAQKVRALSINRKKKEMAVLSLNAFFHLWDIERFMQIWSSRLPCGRENVCMAVNEERSLYAIGSHSLITLVDSRKKLFNTINRERVLFQGTYLGIRSLSFRKDVVTVGTGLGQVLFFDVRAMRYLDHNDDSRSGLCQLTVGPGWLRDDDNFRDIFFGSAYPNAIYTHAYDDSGVRLFTAGGPLPAGLWGNYAGLWA